MLRKERTTGSEQGALIDSFLKEGKIVPVEVSLGLLKKEILKLGHQRYLIDGFPRNQDNLQGWMRMMTSVCDVEMIVFLDCNEVELERRILERGLTSNRSDDNAATAKKRFVTFQTETMPVVRHFNENKDFYFVKLNGDRKITEVYDDLRKVFIPKLSEEMQELNHKLFSCIINGDRSMYAELSGESSLYDSESKVFCAKNVY